jgi:hypothetical protein
MALTLTIEPGVEVDAEQHDVSVNGAVIATIERLTTTNPNGTITTSFIGPRMRKQADTLDAAVKTVVRNTALAAVTTWEKEARPAVPKGKLAKVESEIISVLDAIELLMADGAVLETEIAAAVVAAEAQIEQIEEAAAAANITLIRADPKPESKTRRRRA